MNQQQRLQKTTLSFLGKLARAKVRHGAKNADEYVAGYETLKNRTSKSSEVA